MQTNPILGQVLATSEIAASGSIPKGVDHKGAFDKVFESEKREGNWAGSPSSNGEEAAEPRIEPVQVRVGETKIDTDGVEIAPTGASTPETSDDDESLFVKTSDTQVQDEARLAGQNGKNGSLEDIAQDLRSVQTDVDLAEHKIWTNAENPPSSPDGRSENLSDWSDHNPKALVSRPDEQQIDRRYSADRNAFFDTAQKPESVVSNPEGGVVPQLPSGGDVAGMPGLKIDPFETTRPVVQPLSAVLESGRNSEIAVLRNVVPVMDSDKPSKASLTFDSDGSTSIEVRPEGRVPIGKDTVVSASPMADLNDGRGVERRDLAEKTLPRLPITEIPVSKVISDPSPEKSDLTQKVVYADQKVRPDTQNDTSLIQSRQALSEPIKMLVDDLGHSRAFPSSKMVSKTRAIDHQAVQMAQNPEMLNQDKGSETVKPEHVSRPPVTVANEIALPPVDIDVRPSDHGRSMMQTLPVSAVDPASQNLRIGPDQQPKDALSNTGRNLASIAIPVSGSAKVVPSDAQIRTLPDVSSASDLSVMALDQPKAARAVPEDAQAGLAGHRTFPASGSIQGVQSKATFQPAAYVMMQQVQAAEERQRSPRLDSQNIERSQNAAVPMPSLPTHYSQALPVSASTAFPVVAQQGFDSLQADRLDGGRSGKNDAEGLGLGSSTTVVASASASETPKGGIDAGLARTVSQQLAAHIPAARNGAIEISMRPEELGRVRMTMTVSEGAINVVLMAERAETADLLRRHMDVLGQEFKEMGYSDVSFEFDGSGQDQADQDDADQRQKPQIMDADEIAQPITRSLAATAVGGIDIRL